MVTTNESNSKYLVFDLLHRRLNNVYYVDKLIQKEHSTSIQILTLKYRSAYMMKELEQIYQLLNKLEAERVISLPGQNRINKVMVDIRKNSQD